MADNFVSNAGTGGSTFAAEDIGAGVLATNVKEMVGPHGTGSYGWTPYRVISAASTNAANVKASAAEIGFIYAVNLNAAVRYLKLYNKASSPTVGTDTPVATLPIPASTTGAGFTISIPAGLAFSTGLSLAITTGYLDSDTGAVAAGEQFVLLGYA